ncbi:MAG: hypothetical protein KAR20_14420 [Candidatus Heimdallarchaeota archaeon]|nr:hypothetical protein [Candidatus Heimdallarchaeota archaeon]
MEKLGSFWSSNKKRVIFFGASKGGEGAYRCLRSAYRVLAFADNDSRKQGKNLFGKPIIKPDEIASYPYDLIFISCESHFQVYLQLTSMGIDAKKIRMVDLPIMMGEFELSKVQGLLLFLAVYGFGRLFFDLCTAIL